MSKPHPLRVMQLHQLRFCLKMTLDAAEDIGLKDPGLEKLHHTVADWFALVDEAYRTTALEVV